MAVKQNYRKKFEESQAILRILKNGNAIIVDECQQLKANLAEEKRRMSPRQSDEQEITLLKRQLADRPEKIVEREVLPPWVKPVVILPMLGMIGMFLAGLFCLSKTETPVLSPYAVYITKLDPLHGEDLKVCKEAWSQNEFENKVLRRKIRHLEGQ